MDLSNDVKKRGLMTVIVEKIGILEKFMRDQQLHSSTRSGHIVQDSGTSLTQRGKLNFLGMAMAEDDSANDATKVMIFPSYRYQKSIESEFLSDNEELTVAAFTAGGAVAYQPGESNHPGIVRLSSVAINNTGAGIRLVAGAAQYLDALLVGGGESFQCIFRVQSTNANIITILGYQDSAISTAPVDGMYINIAGSTLTGKTVSNSVGSTTSTSYTVSTATWYRAVVITNSAGTQVDFYLYNATTGALLWTNSLTTTIPLARNTSMFSKSYRTNNVATDLIDVDRMIYYNTRQIMS